MGGSVSTGKNNDDLIDKLVDGNYIKTQTVERVFRAVDRGDYITDDLKTYAYRDVAWKDGNVHLSAPCIYSIVMENLQLKPGMSFLNLGSGSGYLNTMVGLIIGSGGINHGIEIYSDVVEYAEERLRTFRHLSKAIDEYDFSVPKFVAGNCLCLEPSSMKYDRVYCGAACPDTHLNYIKNLIKVGGILVIPLFDQLYKVARTQEDKWDMIPVLPVSFSSLILPTKNTFNITKLPEISPLQLQEGCKVVIRKLLKSVIDSEYPYLTNLVRRRVKPNAINKPLIGSDSQKRDLKSVHANSHGLKKDVSSRSARNYFHDSNMESNDDDSEDNLPRKRYKSSVVTLLDSYFQNNENTFQNDDNILDLSADNQSNVANHKSRGNESRGVDYSVSSTSGNSNVEDHEAESDGASSEASSNATSLLSQMRFLHNKICRVLSVITENDFDQSDELGEDDKVGKSEDDLCSYHMIESDNLLGIEESDLDCESDSSSDNEDVLDSDEEVTESYTVYMTSKIQKLPLPLALKVYLNNDRSL